MLTIICGAFIVYQALGHMSLFFPTIRNKKNGYLYRKWQANEPIVPQGLGSNRGVCHGTDVSASVPPKNRFSVGDIIPVQLYGTVPHKGGHCSFWYSTDDKIFTKIKDVKDCTLKQAINVQIADTLPIQCTERCTFAFSWIPKLSGACEIYQNCADISVSGLTGLAESNPQRVNFTEFVNSNQPSSYENSKCKRVNDTTHWSEIFEPVIEQQEPVHSPPGAPSPPPSSSSAPAVPTGISINLDCSIAGLAGLHNEYLTVMVNNIASVCYVEYIEIKSEKTDWEACTNIVLGASTAYQCEISTQEYPVDVRLFSNHGESLEIDNLITNGDCWSVFQSDVNFGGPKSIVTNMLPTVQPVQPVQPTETTQNLTSCEETLIELEQTLSDLESSLNRIIEINDTCIR